MSGTRGDEGLGTGYLTTGRTRGGEPAEVWQPNELAGRWVLYLSLHKAVRARAF